MTKKKRKNNDDEQVDIGEELFAIVNKSTNGAPSVVWEEARYRGYFENHRGEQWIVVDYDVEDMGGYGVIVAGSDNTLDGNWIERTFSLEELREPVIQMNIMLEPSERAWLVACLTAIRAYRFPHDRRPVMLSVNPRVSA